MKPHNLRFFLDFFSISPAFLLLLAWVNFLDSENILPLALLACFFHELGHIFAIYCCGGTISGISLGLMGAEMPLPPHFSYRQEMIASFAGPAVNILLALCFCKGLPLFAGLNLALALLNLLPLRPLDGGRMLACFLALCLPYSWKVPVQNLCDTLGASTVVILGFLLLFCGGSITLLLLGLWLAQGIWKNRSGKLIC